MSGSIGFIGLGQMGEPMARNLLKAGFAVRVYNRTTAKGQALVSAGARAVDSPAEAVEPALRRFEDDRLRVGRRIIERARHLGAYMQARFRTEDERRFAERYRTPEAVMRETATMDFLRS